MAHFLTPECYYDYAALGAARLCATGGHKENTENNKKGGGKKGAQDGGGCEPLVPRGEAECMPPPYITSE